MKKVKKEKEKEKTAKTVTGPQLAHIPWTDIAMMS